jgi:type VI secretion system protein VasG
MTSRTSLLDQSTFDLTESARRGEQPEIVDRVEETRDLGTFLNIHVSDDSVARPILVGNSGAGKSAVVLQLARWQAEGLVGGHVERILRLDEKRFLDGITPHSEEAWNRFGDLLGELEQTTGHSVLAIPSLVALANVIFPRPLGEGDFYLLASRLAKCRGSFTAEMTPREYEEYVAPHDWLSRRFQIIEVAELGEDETVTFLRYRSKELESRH